MTQNQFKLEYLIGFKVIDEVYDLNLKIMGP